MWWKEGMRAWVKVEQGGPRGQGRRVVRASKAWEDCARTTASVDVEVMKWLAWIAKSVVVMEGREMKMDGGKRVKRMKEAR